jgi:hypothetical protein
MKTKETASRSYSSELLLLFAAIIWGGAFVFQGGGQVIGHLLGGIRFFLEQLCFAVLFLMKKNKNAFTKKKTILSGIFRRGLFFATSTQQIGINHTTVGKVIYYRII